MQEVIWSPGVPLDAVERMVIEKAYVFFRRNKIATADSLGIAVRTLDNKLERYEQEKKIEIDRQAKEQITRDQFMAKQRGNVGNNEGVRPLPRELMLPPHLREKTAVVLPPPEKLIEIEDEPLPIEVAQQVGTPKVSPTTYGGAKRK